MLNVILGRNDIQILRMEVQKVEKSPSADGRSVVLDIFAVDSSGKHYDIEVQRADQNTHGVRHTKEKINFLKHLSTGCAGESQWKNIIKSDSSASSSCRAKTYCCQTGRNPAIV